jgi:hypothetical protein
MVTDNFEPSRQKKINQQYIAGNPAERYVTYIRIVSSSL